MPRSAAASRASAASLALVAFVLAACSSDAPTAASVGAAAGASPTFVAASRTTDVIPGQYIVVFKPGTANGNEKSKQKVDKAKGKLKHTYSAVINGFAAELSDASVAALRDDPDVELIEPDPVVVANATQVGAPWGLDRLDQLSLPLNSSYSYALTGTGVTVYIVDTGINTAHIDFGGRAVAGFDAVTAGGTAADCHGHGTHVAGTVGGATYGVAKGVRLVAVRVLDCTGNGSGSSLLAGLDWIVNQKRAAPSTPMVLNMSLSASASVTLDNAVANAINSGVTAVTAAGNAATSACNSSPARLAAAITVGATNDDDSFASFSNSGSCVDISAPGVSIISASNGSTNGAVVMSGTSMASPHVAGAAALYLSSNPSATPAQVQSALTGNAASSRISGLPFGTPDRLLNLMFLGGSAPVESKLTITTAAPSLLPGGSASVTASVTNAITGVAATWQTRNAAVATAASNGLLGATISAVGAGTTYVVASYVGATGVSRDSVLVTVAAPAPTATLLVSGTGTGCMAVDDIAASKSSARIAACVTGAANELWTLPATGTTGIVRVGNGLCLDAWGASGSIGTEEGTWPCVPTAPNHQWTLNTSGELRGQNGYCATVTPFGTTTRITLQVCTGATTQKWTTATTAPAPAPAPAPTPAPAPAPSPSPSVTLLVSTTGNGCLAVDDVYASKSYVRLAPCVSDAVNQLWTTPSVGASGLMQVGNGLCLDAWGRSGAVGTEEGTWPCVADAPNHQWTLTAVGELRGQNGYCATVTPDGATTRLTLQVCTGAATQRWTTTTTAPTPAPVPAPAPAPAPAPTPAPTPGSALLSSALGTGCLAVDDVTVARSYVRVAPCVPGAANQMWTLPAVGTTGLVQVGNGFCLDAWGRSGAIGTEEGTWPCVSDAPNHQWTFTAAGELRGQNSYCATVTPDGSTTRLTLQICTGAATQKFTATSASSAANAGMAAAQRR